MKKELLKQKKELEAKLIEVNKQLNEIESEEQIKVLKKNKKLKKYKVIFYSEDDDDCLKMGLCSFNEGYIDDHIPEDMEDVIYDLLFLLPLGGETNSCTYAVIKGREDRAREILSKIGIKEVAPEW